MKRFLLLAILLVLNCTAVHHANKFYKQGDISAAIQECKQILASDSLNARAYFILGNCYLEQGKVDSAVDAFNNSYKINPIKKVKSALISAKLQFSDTLLNKEDRRGGRDELLAVVELDSNHVLGQYKLGNYYFENGLLDYAEEHYQKVLSLDPTHAAANEKLENIAKRSDSAQSIYEKGVADYQKYDYQSTIRKMEQVLKSKPDHKDAQYYLSMSKGCLLYRKGSKKACWDAIEEFGKCMSLRPDSGEPHYFMALAYEKKNRDEYDNAIEEYKIAVEKEPDGWFAKQAQKKVKALTAEKEKMRKFWGK